MSRWICTVPGRSVVGCTLTSRSARATASFSRSQNSRLSRSPSAPRRPPASSAAATTSVVPAGRLQVHDDRHHRGERLALHVPAESTPRRQSPRRPPPGPRGQRGSRAPGSPAGCASSTTGDRRRPRSSRTARGAPRPCGEWWRRTRWGIGRWAGKKPAGGGNEKVFRAQTPVKQTVRAPAAAALSTAASPRRSAGWDVLAHLVAQAAAGAPSDSSGSVSCVSSPLHCGHTSSSSSHVSITCVAPREG